MNVAASLALLLCAASLVACERAPTERAPTERAPTERTEPSTGPVIDVPPDDAGMVLAIRNAQGSFPEAWAEYQAGHSSVDASDPSFIVKAKFADPEDADQVEHMWVGQLSFENERVDGTLLSEPRDLAHLSLNQPVSFPVEDLSDWMWIRDGVATGAYTVQLLRSRMTEEERLAHDAAYPFRFPKGAVEGRNEWEQ